MAPICGPVADHMALHILMMNLLAPVAAYAAADAFRVIAPALRRTFPAIVALQIAVLWGWHAPGVLEEALASPALHALMQVSLLGVALWFWAGVFALTGASRWRSLLALLTTGKLFCLLGVLLVFAPRLLYPSLAFGDEATIGFASAGLQDQQLAGLMMLVACPISYLVAAVVISVQWLDELDRADAGAPARVAAK